MKKSYHEALKDFDEFTTQIHTARMATTVIVHKIRSCCNEKGANYFSVDKDLTDAEKEDLSLEAKMDFLRFKKIHIKVAPTYLILHSVCHNVMAVTATFADSSDEVLARVLLFKEQHGGTDVAGMSSFSSETERNEFLADNFTRMLITSLSNHIPTLGNQDAEIL